MNRLKGLIGVSNINKALALKMFDQLIYPILSYGSEIWGAQDFIKMLRPNNKNALKDIYTKLPQEKLNIHFCKYILGVSSKATNIAAMAELGRFPLYIRLIPQMIKYYVRVCNMGEGSLLKQALHEMEKRDSHGQSSWVAVVKYILTDLNLNFDQNEQNHADKIAKIVRHKLEERFRLYWRKKVNQPGKLDTYKELKAEFRYEGYLDSVNNRENQIAITRLRISNHRLMVEVGRYQKPYLPREKRLCSFGADIEDEFHFLFQCPLLIDTRRQHFGKGTINGERICLLKQYISDFDGVSPKSVGTFIIEGMQKREAFLTN